MSVNKEKQYSIMYGPLGDIRLGYGKIIKIEGEVDNPTAILEVKNTDPKISVCLPLSELEKTQ